MESSPTNFIKNYLNKLYSNGFDVYNSTPMAVFLKGGDYTIFPIGEFFISSNEDDRLDFLTQALHSYVSFKYPLVECGNPADYEDAINEIFDKDFGSCTSNVFSSVMRGMRKHVQADSALVLMPVMMSFPVDGVEVPSSLDEYTDSFDDLTNKGHIGEHEPCLAAHSWWLNDEGFGFKTEIYRRLDPNAPFIDLTEPRPVMASSLMDFEPHAFSLLFDDEALSFMPKFISIKMINQDGLDSPESNLMS